MDGERRRRKVGKCGSEDGALRRDNGGLDEGADMRTWKVVVVLLVLVAVKGGCVWLRCLCQSLLRFSDS